MAQGKSPELVTVTRARWDPELEFVVETVRGWLVREEPTRIVLLLPSGPEIALAAEEVIEVRRELAIEFAVAIRVRNAVTKITYQRGGELITVEGRLVGETPEFVRVVNDEHDLTISKTWIVELDRVRA